MSKNSKTKMLKKGIYTPGKTQSQPAPAKAEYTSNPENKGKFFSKKQDESKMNRREKRRASLLIRRGVDKKELEGTNTFILCHIYGSYTIEDGVREVKVRKRDDHHKVIEEKTEQVPNVLHGCHAVMHLIRQNLKEKFDKEEIKIASVGGTYVFLKLKDNKDLDDVKKVLEPAGRITVYKTGWPAKPKHVEKKPSNNTKDKAEAAKSDRKESNVAKKDMRPYYAARRKYNQGVPVNKCVSYRIRVHNAKLARDIEDWLKGSCAAPGFDESTKLVSTGRRCKKGKCSRRFATALCTLDIKRRERLKKERQRIATLKKMKAAQAVKMASNQAKRNASKKPVQTELKMAA